MQNCSTCLKAVEINPLSHVCNMGSAKYVISNYPVQGENCNTYEQIQGGKNLLNVKKQDPLISFFGRFKKEKDSSQNDDAERKILEAYEKNMGKTETTVHSPFPIKYPEKHVVAQEINFKYAVGWIISAVLSGTLISLWLLGLIG